MTSNEQIDISVPGLDERGAAAVERQLLGLPGGHRAVRTGSRHVDTTIVSDDELLAAIGQHGYHASFLGEE